MVVEEGEEEGLAWDTCGRSREKDSEHTGLGFRYLKY
jgi:hypothetical protein